MIPSRWWPRFLHQLNLLLKQLQRQCREPWRGQEGFAVFWGACYDRHPLLSPAGGGSEQCKELRYMLLYLVVCQLRRLQPAGLTPYILPYIA